MVSNRHTLGHINGHPFRVSKFWILGFILLTYVFSRPTIINESAAIANHFENISIQQPAPETASIQVLFSILIVGTLYLSVVLHELGHIYGAQIHGLTVGGITLTLLGGYAEIAHKESPPRADFTMVITGPVVTFLFTLVFLGALLATRPLSNSLLTTYIFTIALVNTITLVGNLLPVYPFDGGRLLHATLGALVGYRRGTRYTIGILNLSAIIIGVISLLTLYPPGVLLSAAVFIVTHIQERDIEAKKNLMTYD